MRDTLVVAISIVAASTVGTLTFGCSHSPTEAEPIVIRILGEDSSNLRAMMQLGSRFVQEQKEHDRNVRIEFEPASFEDAGLRANADFRGQAGRYDIVLQYNFSLAQYADNNFVYRTRELIPLVAQGAPKQVADSLFPEIWHEVGYYYSSKDHSNQAIEAIGYPFAANTMLLVYNRRFYDDPRLSDRYRRQTGMDLRPATEWPELQRQAAFLSTVSRNKCGIALQGKAPEWLYYEWMNILHGFGGRVMQKQYGWQGGPETSLELNTRVATDAADYYRQLKPYACGDFFNMDAPLQRKLLLEDDAPLAIMWSDYLYELVKNGSAKGLSFGFAPVPGERSLIGGGAYYINRKSKHPDLAAQLVFFMLRPANQIELAQAGLCSPVRSVYGDPRLDALPYIGALRTSLERASYMLEAGPDSGLISSRISEALQRIWRGAPSASILEGLQRDLTAERRRLFSQARDGDNAR